MKHSSDIKKFLIDESSNTEDKGHSIWHQLIGKPSQEDIEYDISQSSNPQYVPMTTRKEIWAWYCFDMSTNPFGMVAVGLVIPVYLSIIATRYACKYNAPNGCDYDNNPILAPSSTLVVYIGDWALKPEAYATLMISLSGAVQAVGYLWFTSIADYSNYQTILFRLCILLGNFMIISLFFIPDKYWLFIGIFTACLRVPVGLAGVYYNAYLPVLVENHWLIGRLQRTFKSSMNVESYYNERKKLLRSIQDEMSQFGIFCGYSAGLFAAAMAGVGFFLLEDITVEITDGYGIYSDNNAYNVDIYTFNDEYWIKPIIGMDIWYSHINVTNVSNSEPISTDSFIHGIRFNYGEIFENGSVYGVTNDSEFIISYDTDTLFIETEFIHSHFTIDSDIIQVNLYIHQQMSQQNVINGIEFVMINNNSVYAGDTSMYNYTEIIEVKPDKYPNYKLSGYQISTGVYVNNNTDYNISMPIIYGYSFAFMDIDEGQYGSTIDNRLIYALCGVWGLIFAIPAFFILKSRPKNKILSKSKKCAKLGRCPSICTISFKDYYYIIRDAATYPNLFRCLIAWFIWSDAQNTTGSIGILFGQIELGMNQIQLLLLLLELNLLALLGNIFFIWFQKKFNLSSKHLMIFHLFINMLLPIWAMFGLFDWSPIGLLNIWEMYVVAGLFFGTQLGSLFSASRSLYGHLIPKGKESQFFGLYQLTDKGSAWIGPLLSTLIANNSSLRYAIIYILVFYIISIPILQFGVNYEQGMIDAGKIKPLLSLENNEDNEDNNGTSKHIETDTNKETMDETQTSVISGFNVHSYGST